jgi:hypothetical protein
MVEKLRNTLRQVLLGFTNEAYSGGQIRSMHGRNENCLQKLSLKAEGKKSFLKPKRRKDIIKKDHECGVRM